MNASQSDVPVFVVGCCPRVTQARELRVLQTVPALNARLWPWVVKGRPFIDVLTAKWVFFTPMCFSEATTFLPYESSWAVLSKCVRLSPKPRAFATPARLSIDAASDGFCQS